MKIIGVGNTAEVLEYGEGKVCKLFYESYPESAILREYSNAQLVDKLQLPVPKVYDKIQIGSRTGILYSRLYGETVLDKILRNEDMTPLIKKITDVHKEIIGCHTVEGISYKDFFRSLLRNELDKDQEINKQIDELPEGDCLCHGDFHPGNVWINLQGTTLIIDFMNICHGPWQYDVARSYYLMSKGSLPEHIANKEEMRKMQKLLADLYLKNMNVTYHEIEPYILVIEVCRKYEV